MLRRARDGNPGWPLSLAAAAAFGLSAFLKDGAGKLLVALGIVAVIYVLIFMWFRRTGDLPGERGRRRRAERRLARDLAKRDDR